MRCAVFHASASIACISRPWSSCRSSQRLRFELRRADRTVLAVGPEQRQTHRDHRAQHVGRDSCRRARPAESRSSRRASRPACAVRAPRRLPCAPHRCGARSPVGRDAPRGAPRAWRAAPARRAAQCPRAVRAPPHRHPASTTTATGTSHRHGRDPAAVRAAWRRRDPPAARRVACLRPRRSAPWRTGAAARPSSTARRAAARAEPMYASRVQSRRTSRRTTRSRSSAVASIAVASCCICRRESWRDFPGWNSCAMPSSSIVMSSSSRLKESTGTLTTPSRSSGSISSPSITARSRMAAPCARISRSIASRSMAVRSAAASVKASAGDARAAGPATATAASARGRADSRFAIGNMHTLRKDHTRRGGNRRRSGWAGCGAT